MPKAFSPKIVSANDLMSGQTIYRAEGGWSADITDAVVAGDEETAAALLAAAESQPEIAVGPYLVDVVGEDRPAPTKYREVIRVTGPTVGALNAPPAEAAARDAA